MIVKHAAGILFTSAIFALAAPNDPQSATVKDIVSRLDHGAAQFQTMSAAITRTKHTEVLNDNSTDSGTVAMKKLGARGLQGLMDITAPDKKTYAFSGGKIEIYYPNMKTVEEYDFGQQAEELERFFMLGFGTSGAELEKSYELRVGGTETLNGQKTTRLALVPKAEQGRKLVKQVDLWIPERGEHPIQERVVEPSGDYTLMVYRDLKINPNLKETDLKLTLPKGVKKVYPQK